MKLSPLTIYIIGASLFLVIATYGFFQHWIPNKAEEEMYSQNLTLLEAEAAKMPQAQKRRDTAIAAVKLADAAWAVIASKRTPPSTLAAGGIDLTVNRWQLSVDTRKFRNNVQRQLNRQLRTGGVEVLAGPYVPGINENDPANAILSSYYNMPPFAFPVVIYDLGQVTVRGTYKQITENMRSWARMPNYLAVADGLVLSGTSPNLTGTYNLQMVGFIRSKKVSPPVPEGQAAGGGSAPGGLGGPGGFPGGSGMPSGPGGPGMRGGPPMSGFGGPSSYPGGPGGPGAARPGGGAER
jgi:hypothetical protein